MRLKTSVIERLKSRRDIKETLMSQLEITYMTLFTWMKRNDENGKLTTFQALTIISNGLNEQIDELIENDVQTVLEPETTPAQ
jgi:hypothetical protein